MFDNNIGTPEKEEAAPEAMRLLDVYHCPARVLQLRKDGHQIVTHRKTVITEAGAKHTVGVYVLQRGAGHA